MVKSSQLVAGQAEYVTTGGEKVTARALCAEDIAQGIEQIEEAINRNEKLKGLLSEMVASDKEPTTADGMRIGLALIPVALDLTDIFGSACGKDGKWLKSQALLDLAKITTLITELTRPAETVPLFFVLFRTWRATFKAMSEN